MNQMENLINKIKLLNDHNNWQDILGDWLRTEITYTSNSIEGNTLSLIEINEAINHANAWDYITNILTHIDLKNLKIDHILKLHSIILTNIDDNQKGKFRSVPVRISGSNTILPNPLKVNNLMKELFSKINNFEKASIQNIIKLAIMTHLEMVKIHPFIDGNGRTSRLLMNTILKHYELPPISVDPKNRDLYLQSLENSDIENPKEFVEFMELQYLQNIEKYFASF
jgi:Fic family protein